MCPAVHAHTCASVDLRAMLGVVSQALPALFFLRWGSFTGEELSEQGRLAASGLQDLPGLCFPNTGIVDSCHPA